MKDTPPPDRFFTVQSWDFFFFHDAFFSFAPLLILPTVSVFPETVRRYFPERYSFAVTFAPPAFD
jgi:hypothetical protein